nr:unnamed protein product [Spirometra erinaceieuropaei]
MPGDADSGPDFKRLGIFKELGYTTINDPYTVVRPDKLFRNLQNEPGMRPMILAGGFSKTKASTDDGYFAPFARVFEGEAGSNIIQLRRAWRKENNAKKLAGDWVYSSPAKKRQGIGSPYGCFQEQYPAMSREAKRVEKQPELHNFYTNPGKKGTGYGYLDVTINPYPEWMAGATTLGSQHEVIMKANEEHKQLCLGRPVFVSQQHSGEAFDPEIINGVNPLAPGGPVVHKFGNSASDKSRNIGPTFLPSSPAKWDGGCKDGCLSKFPAYIGDPYIDQYRLMIQKIKKSPEDAQLRPWVPQPPTAVEIPTPSVVNRNIDLAINAKTRKKRLHVMPFCKKK